ALALLRRAGIEQRFPEEAARLRAWREAVTTLAPPAPAGGRLVIDVTGLVRVLAAGAHPGGIERTIVETVLALDEHWEGRLTLVAWKDVAVEVSLEAFRDAVFRPRPRAGDRAANPMLDAELVAGERRFEPGEGDVVVILGSAWHYDASTAIQAACRDHGARIVLLVHDLLQIFQPALVSGKWSAIFRRWIGPALDQADLVLVNSTHSGREIETFCRETGREVPDWVRIELGDDFRRLPRPDHGRSALLDRVLAMAAARIAGEQPGASAATINGAPAAALPGGGDIDPGGFGTPAPTLAARGPGYVLYVSAIGKRKNHDFLVRAWARAYALLGAACPFLVIVGGRGDGAAALDRAMAETAAAGGRALILHNVPDDD
ncbi:MAG: hypothetical protein AAFZ09_17070, partial [Pseudomonadota bacterium]